jgi:hypothetical protein
MEVHHHPEVGKKNFKEYLLEGLMIFVAVTLGFFAESLREHINHHSREQEYAASFVEDLRSDTSLITQKVSQNIYGIVDIDTLQALLLSHDVTPSGTLKAYKLMDNAQNPRIVPFSERTYNEIRSAGGAEIISNREVSNAIEDYQMGVRDCQGVEKFYIDQARLMATNAKMIFRPQYRFGAARRYWTVTDSSVDIADAYAHMMDSVAAHTTLTFATTDPKTFDDYCSDLGFYQEIVVSYVRGIQAQRRSAVKLLALLQQTYDLDPTPPTSNP